MRFAGPGSPSAGPGVAGRVVKPTASVGALPGGWLTRLLERIDQDAMPVVVPELEGLAPHLSIRGPRRHPNGFLRARTRGFG
jgi:hypothetical protein